MQEKRLGILIGTFRVSVRVALENKFTGVEVGERTTRTLDIKRFNAKIIEALVKRRRGVEMCMRGRWSRGSMRRARWSRGGWRRGRRRGRHSRRRRDRWRSARGLRCRWKRARSRSSRRRGAVMRTRRRRDG